ncbi:hypothetical protein [Acetilactobacillus jinshanensis]|uniref:Surface layer protein A domain-containing protein n=1 Tax=Acetilactobacillus jinshanensis TaxID=1720083 RepID=A0A4V1ALP4_9LACO|nr:hypothetical protein [Acetilactobacillus jinshanensis]QBP18309.1 hypothetical protein ELX58_03975 [Acetilactobacillus jinshanensis]URL61174.1 hypothetical protein HGK75_04040 [uncultured bacterium]
MKLNLRKMVTVSAAALMLAGVGASATNAGTSVHASRRIVRMSSLRIHENRLVRQVNHDKAQFNRDNSQLKQVKREIARLSPKSNKKGKRSKKSVRRNKRAKKGIKKNNRRVKHAKNVKKNTAKQQPKVTTYRTHIVLNNKVYTAEIISNGKIGQVVPRTAKYVGTMKAYAKKYTKPFLAARNAVNANMIQFKKTHNMKYYKNALKANQSLRSMAVTPVNASQPAKK